MHHTLFSRSVAPLVFLASLLLVLLPGCSSSDGGKAAGAEPLVVYSSRNEHLIKPLFERFTAETGIPVQYVTDKAGPLMARLGAEGASTPADLFMTVDVGNLWQAAEKGLLKPVNSTVLNDSIPAHLRDPGNHWFGLSVRARTIVYATDRVQPAELSTYEALADPAWQGRLCLRTSKKVYNQSLVASLIAANGAEATEKVVAGWVDNLATDPFSSDTLVMQAVAAGQCDVTIVNTYYYGRLLKENPDTTLALFWPNQEERGVHVNISGAGITQHAKHPQQAQQLLEWLAAPEAQRILADLNQEYPVNPAVEPAPEVAAWGRFKEDPINVEVAGRLQADAVKLMDRAGYR